MPSSHGGLRHGCIFTGPWLSAFQNASFCFTTFGSPGFGFWILGWFFGIFWMVFLEDQKKWMKRIWWFGGLVFLFDVFFLFFFLVVLEGGT